MSGPLAVAAARPRPADLAGAAAALLTATAVAVLVAGPLAAVLLAGLGAPMPAPGVLRHTVAVGAVSALAALGLAAILAGAVRAGAPGHWLVLRGCRLGLVVPPFVAPLALLVLTGGAGTGARLEGLSAIALAQAFAFLPHAFALLTRALAVVPAELEQAAEILGASRWTVLRRVTLGLAGPRLGAAALVLMGLTLGDVAAPLLLGGDQVVLATAVVEAVARGNQAATAAAALALGGLTAALALVGRTWRHAAGTLAPAATSASSRHAPGPVRGILGGLATGIMVALVALWAIVPAASLLSARDGGWRPSLEHWLTVLGGPAVRALGNSLLLGLGVAVVGTGLALAAAWIVERRRGAAGAALAALGGVPAAVPGVVAGAGALLALGAPTAHLAVVVLVVAAWEFPLAVRVAANLIRRRDRAAEQVAATLGASLLTTLARITLPALKPAAAWLAGHGLAAGVATVGAVLVLAGPDVEIGVVYLFASASAGPAGAACAVATILLAIAGGAALLGRAAAGRESSPTLLA